MHKAPMTAYQRAIEEFRRRFLTDKLREHGGNRTKTAHALGMQRTYLLRLIRELALDVPTAIPARIKASEVSARDAERRQVS